MKTRSDSKRKASVHTQKKQLQLKLLREVLFLLRKYGPLWYKEELDARLANSVGSTD
jgi:hypothetical protein